MNGLIVVNKEQGYTSRDVVNTLVKKFKTKKIGHTGTLDPLATGVLVICLGKYTKLVDKITSYDKEYIAKIKLGCATDTLDITGKVLKEEAIPNLTKEQIENTLNSFLGTYEQEVPKYSAIKIKGKKLYEYARNNEEITLPKRKVEISKIELLSFQDDTIEFSCTVSKGTYIRSLIRDICHKLNVLGTMSSLTRTRQGIFTLDKAYTLQDIANDTYYMWNISDLFPYNHYALNEEEYQKVLNGGFLKIPVDDSFLVLDYQNESIAVYQNIGEYFKTYFHL